MGSIKRIENKDESISYLVHIQIKGSKRVSRSFKSMKEAELYEVSEEAKIREKIRNFGKPGTSEFYKERFKDAIDAYLKEVISLDPKNKKGSHLRTVFANVGDESIGDIRKSFGREYWERMKGRQTETRGTFAPSTIAKHLSAMAVVYRWRADQHDVMLTSTPFSASVLPKNWDTERERRFEIGEEAALRRAIRNACRKPETRKFWRCLIALALETGARLQELILSTWSEFNIKVRVWNIPAKHCKTRKARGVPLSDRALAALRVLQTLRLDAKPSRRVFRIWNSPDSVSARFCKIRDSSGLVDFRFHDLRHEAISRMVLHRRKLSVYEIMKVVGHSTVEMLNRYANLRGEELVERFNA